MRAHMEPGRGRATQPSILAGRADPRRRTVARSIAMLRHGRPPNLWISRRMEFELRRFVSPWLHCLISGHSLFRKVQSAMQPPFLPILKRNADEQIGC